MNSELQQHLMESFNLNEEQIASLGEYGVQAAEDMKFLLEKDLTEIGVPRIIARRILAEYSEQPTEAQRDDKIQVNVQTGKLEDKTLSELLQLLANGEQDVELRQLVRQKIRGYDCFIRVDEELDVLATMECFEYMLETGVHPDMWGGQPTESLDEVLDKRREADPLTGEPLVNGKSQDGVDWTGVSEQNRVYAAFANQQGLLTGNEDRFTLAEELEEAQPTGRWGSIIARYKHAQRNDPEKVAQARAALIYRRKGGAASGRPFRHNGLEI